MMEKLLLCSTNGEINVQMYKVQNKTLSSHKYVQNSLVRYVCTVINVQFLEQFVHLYITSLFYPDSNNTPYKPFVCTLISGKIKTKYKSLIKVGDIHG